MYIACFLDTRTQRLEVHALMALMYFHSSRCESRLSREGELIQLGKQDRSKWYKALITELTKCP